MDVESRRSRRRLSSMSSVLSWCREDGFGHLSYHSGLMVGCIFYMTMRHFNLLSFSLSNENSFSWIKNEAYNYADFSHLLKASESVMWKPWNPYEAHIWRGLPNENVVTTLPPELKHILKLFSDFRSSPIRPWCHWNPRGPSLCCPTSFLDPL